MNASPASSTRSGSRTRLAACTSALLLLMFASPAVAQSPLPQVRQQSQLGWQEYVEFDVRLKGVPVYKDGVQVTPPATVKLISALHYSNLQSQYFTYVIPCWNKTTICPKVAFVTIQAFVKLPWNVGRVNVTKYLLCNGTECSLPDLVPIQAKPGEAYSFRYDRLKAVWDPVPSVIKAP